MGINNTKAEEIRDTADMELPNDALDPRSPNVQRTPINLPKQNQLVPVTPETSKAASDNPLIILRKRFFKGFTYNMNDPRSPSLNRTPLIFEDSSDKTLNLDDTFSDLFVESNVPEQVEEINSCNDFEMADCTKPKEIEELPCPALMENPHFDPRSPSIGVERTPIIFNDDDNDVNEDVILENILTTLTLNNLNLSGTSSIVSMKPEETKVMISKPTNKHLDRIRVGKKTNPKGPLRRQKRALRQKIYEDRENQFTSTPPLKNYSIDGVDSPKTKRTPLSCVRNCSQRSRSLESKSAKTRLPIMSFDDTLNPNENKNMIVMDEKSLDSVL